MLLMLLCKEDFVDFSNVVLGAGVGIDPAAADVLLIAALLLLLLTLYTLSLLRSESSEHSVEDVQSLAVLLVFLVSPPVMMSFVLPEF